MSRLVKAFSQIRHPKVRGIKARWRKDLSPYFSYGTYLAITVLFVSPLDGPAFARLPSLIETQVVIESVAEAQTPLELIGLAFVDVSMSTHLKSSQSIDSNTWGLNELLFTAGGLQLVSYWIKMIKIAFIHCTINFIFFELVWWSWS